MSEAPDKGLPPVGSEIATFRDLERFVDTYGDAFKSPGRPDLPTDPVRAFREPGPSPRHYLGESAFGGNGESYIRSRRPTRRQTARSARQAGREASPPLADAEGHDLRPDPLAAKTPAELMQALRQFRVWSGLPGYRVMARRINHRVAASTLCTALGSDKMPKLEMVQAIIEGCGGSKDDQRLYATAWRQITLGQAGR